MTHNSALITEIDELEMKNNRSSFYTFVYKGRRWYKGAWIAFLDGYEIHTLKGDRCTLVPKTFVCENLKLYIG